MEEGENVHCITHSFMITHIRVTVENRN